MPGRLRPTCEPTPDFITGMTKRAKATEFACHVRNHTGNAVRLTIPFGTLEAAPKMSKAEHERLIATNRERFAAGPNDRGRPRPTANSRVRNHQTSHRMTTGDPDGEHRCTVAMPEHALPCRQFTFSLRQTCWSPRLL